MKITINLDADILSLIDKDEAWLLLHISKRINPQFACWPSNKTLMADTGIKDLRTLRRIKDSLVSKGIIEVNERHRENGSQSSNEYKVRTPAIGVYVRLCDLNMQASEGGASDAPGGVHEMHRGGGAKNAPPIRSINSIKEHIKEAEPKKQEKEQLPPEEQMLNEAFLKAQNWIGEWPAMMNKYREALKDPQATKKQILDHCKNWLRHNMGNAVLMSTPGTGMNKSFVFWLQRVPQFAPKSNNGYSGNSYNTKQQKATVLPSALKSLPQRTQARPDVNLFTAKKLGK